MNESELRLKLIELEVEALRSVLSECDVDKSCFIQIQKADAIANVLNHIVEVNEYTNTLYLRNEE